jgi:hypothetical protein
MAGTSNFQQWNPGSINQENDAAYTSDSLRANGAPSGAIFPSPTANKLFFQLSTMAYAIGQMMANKNYNMLDSNSANLIAALNNLLTNADVPGYLVRQSDVPGFVLRFSDFVCSIAQNGYIKFPTYSPLGGVILQWGLSNAVAGDANSDTVVVTFPLAFPSACFAAIASANAVSPGSHGGTVTQVTARSATSISITMVNADANNHVGAVAAYWFAIGH